MQSNALLIGVANNSDRFAEHAIIFALINLKNPAPLIVALAHSSSNVRRAAVIALDQMDSYPLRKEHLAPFLASKEPQLRNTGIWVASHHAEWADIVINFLQKRLSVADLSATDASSVRDLIITFSENKQIQNFIAGQLANAATPATRKAFLLPLFQKGFCFHKKLYRTLSLCLLPLIHFRHQQPKLIFVLPG